MALECQGPGVCGRSDHTFDDSNPVNTSFSVLYVTYYGLSPHSRLTSALLRGVVVPWDQYVTYYTGFPPA